MTLRCNVSMGTSVSEVSHGSYGRPCASGPFFLNEVFGLNPIAVKTKRPKVDSLIPFHFIKSNLVFNFGIIVSWLLSY